jgi:RNA polymerase sigma-70 factor (ECF subfamily)
MNVAIRENDPESETRAPDPRIEAAAAGDRAAAHALLSELLPRVRNLVRYLCRGDSEVDDMAQLALVEILRSLRTYRNEGSLHGWVDRITVRVTLRRLKQRRADDQRREASLPELRAVSAKPALPDEHTLRRQTVRVLDVLPPEQREAIVLHHVVGLSVPELAAELSIPFETARSRLRLGMEKLREQLARNPDAIS